MNAFIADLHIHSKFSRATSRSLDLENLYIWAQRKGITVVGTGDFTHPEWIRELSEKLEPSEPGLYRLKPELARICDRDVADSCKAPVRFMLSCEISNIYKKRDRTRKNHNLVFFPDIETVRRFNIRMEAIGNIHSDGRPILGLDARDLLEIVLDTSEDGFLIPAHIWTPWFSMLGSKSGFDSLRDCFEDLSSYIFAAETGLSSDPSMNWRVPELDDITLVSNSDAHSPSKLGREANLFATALNYYEMRLALENKDRNGFKGTFEFYPEEGKYHVDGHRKCEVCFTPAQTRSHEGNCPVCGKPLTLGVLHRVEELAARPDGFEPEGAFPFYRLIPLVDLLSEILKVGSQSKKVKHAYDDLLEKLGSEFSILHSLEKETIEQSGVPLLGEAIDRMRKNEVTFFPGYDGLFGKVQLFSEIERDLLLGQQSLFAGFEVNKIEKENPMEPLVFSSGKSPKKPIESDYVEKKGNYDELNEDQRAAVESLSKSSMIIAGPGTGKTRTLTHKIAKLIQHGTDASKIVALTFTNRAAGEMKDRLSTLLGKGLHLPFVGTFHGLGFRLLKMADKDYLNFGIADEKMRLTLIQDSLKINDQFIKKININRKMLFEWIVSAKQTNVGPTDAPDGISAEENLFFKCYETYQHLLGVNHLFDFEDLIFQPVRLLEANSSVGHKLKTNLEHIFIDEFQDVNPGQYRLISLLSGKEGQLTVIGDPDQSIYGFRGSDMNCFSWLLKDRQDMEKVYLRQNYRSSETILQISHQVVRQNPEQIKIGGRQKFHSNKPGEPTIQLVERGTDLSEAVYIGKSIEKMVGGIGFFSLDSGAVDGSEKHQPLSFSDFAVLYRTRRQGDIIFKTLSKAGIPCQLIDKKKIFDDPGIASLISAMKVFWGKGVFSDLQSAMEALNRPVSSEAFEHFKHWAYEKALSMEQALIQAKRFPVPHMGIQRQKAFVGCIASLFEIKKKINNLPVSDRLDVFVKNSKLIEKRDSEASFEHAFTFLLEKAAYYGTNMDHFLSSAALSSDGDLYDSRVEKVTLTTMHSAKGLEFPVVFISGCEDGLIPFRSERLPADEEEERRLFYVALTRAENHLFLTKANQRMIHGKTKNGIWSPFVKDIENRYKRFSIFSPIRPEKPVQVQLSLF